MSLGNILNPSCFQSTPLVWEFTSTWHLVSQFQAPVDRRGWWMSIGWFPPHTHTTNKSVMVQIDATFKGHGLVCFASGLLWIPCPPSIVDPFPHKASPAPTLQTVKRIMWLWWVPIAGGEVGRAHCALCFNDPLVCMLGLLSAPCVSEISPLSPLAEPSVYLPSRKWHQQPGP